MARNSKPKTKEMLFQTSIDIEKEKRQQVIDLLNAQLADSFDMYSQMKQAHWNVKGPQFIALHELFDEIAAGLLAHIDVIAERATAFGGMAMGTVGMAAEATRLTPYQIDVVDSMGTVRLLADRLADLAASTRQAADQVEELHEMGTNDLFLEVSRDLDKWLWFLEAHLQD